MFIQFHRSTIIDEMAGKKLKIDPRYRNNKVREAGPKVNPRTTTLHYVSFRDKAKNTPRSGVTARHSMTINIGKD